MREKQKRRGYDYAPQQMVLEKNESLKIGRKNKWLVQNSTSPCQWDSDHPTETRAHRKNQYTANHTIQAMINCQILIPPTSLVM